MNWAIHRMYFLALVEKGWSIKEAYAEAIRLASEALK
jgi:hypothetical protein